MPTGGSMRCRGWGPRRAAPQGGGASAGPRCPKQPKVIQRHGGLGVKIGAVGPGVAQQHLRGGGPMPQSRARRQSGGRADRALSRQGWPVGLPPRRSLCAFRPAKCSAHPSTARWGSPSFRRQRRQSLNCGNHSRRGGLRQSRKAWANSSGRMSAPQRLVRLTRLMARSIQGARTGARAFAGRASGAGFGSPAARWRG